MDKPRLIANRANARLSTGPQTAAGKARARLNARRHGLAGDLTGEPDVEQLIGVLARDVADPEQRALVREIAESQCTLNRVQAARSRALQAELDRVIKKSVADAAPSERVADDLIGQAVLGASDTLVAIERYERRAFSRRRKAIRTLLVAMEQKSIISSPTEDNRSKAADWQNEPKPSLERDPRLPAPRHSDLRAKSETAPTRPRRH